NAIRLSLFMVYPRLVFFLIQQDTPFLLLYSYTTNKHSSHRSNSQYGHQSQEFTPVGRELLALMPENRAPLARGFRA
ncbi:hypothetical protein NDI52_23890, partial [Leptolyngbya sp. PL-A3]|uniref:hypothetical protein n=1 Tax=Leptolyngbya sp. PL-A3 TaxID=2933911 RepID=UPI003298C16D